MTQNPHPTFTGESKTLPQNLKTKLSRVKVCALFFGPEFRFYKASRVKIPSSQFILKLKLEIEETIFIYLK